MIQEISGWRSQVAASRRRKTFPLGRWLGILLLGPMVVAAIAAPIIAPADPFAGVGDSFQPPSSTYWLGTDDLGRDLLSGVIYGAQTSLIVGATVAILALVLGLAVGLVSGFAGGWIDDLLMRLTELFQIVPRFFLAIAVIALFENNLFNLVIVLALTSWSGLARIARSEVLSLRTRDFVVGARAVGVKPAGILWRHILPNAIQPLLATTALIVSGAILTEAGLSFLGLGDPITAWWLPLFPGLAIVITVLGLSLIIDSLDR